VLLCEHGFQATIASQDRSDSSRQSGRNNCSALT